MGYDRFFSAVYLIDQFRRLWYNEREELANRSLALRETGITERLFGKLVAFAKLLLEIRWRNFNFGDNIIHFIYT